MWWIIGIFSVLTILGAVSDVYGTNDAVKNLQTKIDTIQANQSDMQSDIQLLLSPSPIELQCTPNDLNNGQMDCKQQ